MFIKPSVISYHEYYFSVTFTECHQHCNHFKFHFSFSFCKKKRMVVNGARKKSNSICETNNFFFRSLYLVFFFIWNKYLLRLNFFMFVCRHRFVWDNCELVFILWSANWLLAAIYPCVRQFSFALLTIQIGASCLHWCHAHFSHLLNRIPYVVWNCCVIKSPLKNEIEKMFWIWNGNEKLIQMHRSLRMVNMNSSVVSLYQQFSLHIFDPKASPVHETMEIYLQKQI